MYISFAEFVFSLYAVNSASIFTGEISCPEPNIDPNIYIYFATCYQLCNRKKRKDFSKNMKLHNSPMFKMLVRDNTEIRLGSIGLMDPNKPENDKIWKGPILCNRQAIRFSGFLIDIEIETCLKEFARTGKNNEIRQVRIKINDNIPEFVFMEFIIKGENIEYYNKSTIKEGSIYLENFPLNIRIMDYQLCLVFMTIFLFNLKNENIFFFKPVFSRKNMIRTETKFRMCLSFIFQNTPDPRIFKFSDFNLLLNTNQQFENVQDEFYSFKFQTLVFESTKFIDCYHFTMICENTKETNEKFKQEIKISKDSISNEIVPLDLPYVLVEVQKQKKAMKIILRRPKSDNDKRMGISGWVSIEYVSVNTYSKNHKLDIKAEEIIEDEVITTLFFLKNSWEYQELQNIFNNKQGLVSIQINGVEGIIGTYGICFLNQYCTMTIYSDKLESIPFPG